MMPIPFTLMLTRMCRSRQATDLRLRTSCVPTFLWAFEMYSTKNTALGMISMPLAVGIFKRLRPGITMSAGDFNCENDESIYDVECWEVLCTISELLTYVYKTCIIG